MANKIETSLKSIEPRINLNHNIHNSKLAYQIVRLVGIVVKQCKQLGRPETVEVGCPRHPGATTIGNQLQDGDRTDGWPNLTTQP